MRTRTLHLLGCLVISAGLVSAEEPAPQKPDQAEVVCDSCSARKKGLLKLKEAREAEQSADGETASLEPKDEDADQ